MKARILFLSFFLSLFGSLSTYSNECNILIGQNITNQVSINYDYSFPDFQSAIDNLPGQDVCSRIIFHISGNSPVSIPARNYDKIIINTAATFEQGVFNIGILSVSTDLTIDNPSNIRIIEKLIITNESKIYLDEGILYLPPGLPEMYDFKNHIKTNGNGIVQSSISGRSFFPVGHDTMFVPVEIEGKKGTTFGIRTENHPIRPGKGPRTKWHIINTNTNEKFNVKFIYSKSSVIDGFNHSEAKVYFAKDSTPLDLPTHTQTWDDNPDYYATIVNDFDRSGKFFITDNIESNEKENPDTKPSLSLSFSPWFIILIVLAVFVFLFFVIWFEMKNDK